MRYFRHVFQSGAQLSFFPPLPAVKIEEALCQMRLKPASPYQTRLHENYCGGDKAAR